MKYYFFLLLEDTAWKITKINPIASEMKSKEKTGVKEF